MAFGGQALLAFAAKFGVRVPRAFGFLRERHLHLDGNCSDSRGSVDPPRVRSREVRVPVRGWGGRAAGESVCLSRERKKAE